MPTLFALGLGVASRNRQGEWLEAYYPQPLANLASDQASKLLAALADCTFDSNNTTLALDSTQVQTFANAMSAQDCETCKAQATLASGLTNSSRDIVLVVLTTDAEPASVPEAYLKLHLLSHRLVKPHQTNLSGIFASLPNIAWTSDGPVALDELPERQLEARKQGRWLSVKSVDKFPPMTDYVVPSGVRIADTARVRLGAYVGAGTTIMHEGFINFNAGTAGASMIEGRISAGVFVGEGSDLGGSSSTMGTLSGGGNVVISVGDNCLIGANAGIGIALGDRCTVEAGLYITAGTKVNLLDDESNSVQTIKARDLSGQSDLLFRRNSLNGAVECKTNRSVIELNQALHSNN
jgi:2,3,4,5-tetrahydropyridine-2-carboxylate N-succinyltransferase